MQDMSAFLIPKYLDEPEKILFFSMKEIPIFMAPFAIGMLMGHTIKGLMGAIALFYLYKKIKAQNAGSSITHLFYWYCPEWLFKMSVIPPSHIRIFIG